MVTREAWLCKRGVTLQPVELFMALSRDIAVGLYVGVARRGPAQYCYLDFPVAEPTYTNLPKVSIRFGASRRAHANYTQPLN